MKVHTLDIDSGERDPVLYSNPSDYVVHLKNPIYDVTKISLISARIHNSQYLIHDRNKTFDVLTNGGSTQTVTLDVGNYSGEELAAHINTKCTIITGATFDKDTNAITFTGSGDFTFCFYGGTNGYTSTSSDGYTTPHDILGLPASNVSSSSNSLETGSINLQGPDAIVVKMSSGSDEFNKTVFSETPFYTGRILLCGDVINFSGVDDTVEHNFDSGSQKTISSLRVQFYYSSNNRLIPYDFRHANHILKLAVTCYTNKLENASKMEKTEEEYISPLPTPMSIPEIEDPRKWDAFISIFMVIATGLVLLLIMRKPRLNE